MTRNEELRIKGQTVISASEVLKLVHKMCSTDKIESTKKVLLKINARRNLTLGTIISIIVDCMYDRPADVIRQHTENHREITLF